MKLPEVKRTSLRDLVGNFLVEFAGTNGDVQAASEKLTQLVFDEVERPLRVGRPKRTEEVVTE